MTPLEELQAAHNRLSELQQSVSANVRYKGDSNVRIVSDSHSVPVSPYFELQRTLHRTIDAQLRILQEAIYYGVAESGMVGEEPLELARAINGEAS